MSEIAAVWEKIEKWYAEHGASHLLNPPASEQEIADAENQMGFSFPDDLRESLSRHDGTNEFAWPALASLKQIIRSEAVWVELLENGAFDLKKPHDASRGTDKTRLGWWVKGWIPIQDDSQGNGLVIDMAPGEKGSLGQLIYMDHESNLGASLARYGRLADYLIRANDDLDKGNYIYLDDERIVVEVAEVAYYQRQRIVGS